MSQKWKKSNFYIDHCFEKDISFDGNHIASGYYEEESAKDCQNLCQNTGRCEYFTYYSTMKQCWLKAQVLKRLVITGAISGKKFCDDNGM